MSARSEDVLGLAGAATAAPPPSPSTRARRLRRVALAALALVLAFFGAQLLVQNFDEVTGAFDLVSRPVPGWLALALAAELASFITYAAAQKRLLKERGESLGLPRMTLLAVAAQALGVCIPGGYAWSNVISFRVLRRWRIDEVTAARVLFATAFLYVAALAVLAVVGAQLAGSSGPVTDVSTVAYSVLVLFAIVGALAILRPRQMRRIGFASLEGIERVLGRRERLAAVSRGTKRLRIGLVEADQLGRRSVAVAGGWLLGAWAGDVGCLAAAFAAVGARPPWHGLLLAYCGAQLAALLPITPGGLGVVEGSLTLALVSFGGNQEKTVAAVLLYRLISFWGLVPSGAACYALLRTRRLGGVRASSAQAAAP
ncbi:MAG: YbhN family protein [Thermoleophilaceae bacterium]